jgi:glycogen synthase
MRILMTTDTIGGVWTFTQELAKGLLERGCAICLISFGRPPSDTQQSWLTHMQSEGAERFRYESESIPLEWMESNDRAYRDAAPLLMAHARTFDAELVHSNQFCFGALPLEIPKIITAHSDVVSWAECCRGCALEDSFWLRRYRTLVAEGIAEADSIIAPTYWMAEALARNFPLSKKAEVIPNGRSIPQEKMGNRKLQAVTAGRIWDEAKNIALLREVQSPIPVYIAGESQHGSNRAVTELGGAVLLGALSPEELLALFRESAIYICTSRYEPFGLAPLEAALCGCAVVAHDIASLREVWEGSALYFSDAGSLTTLLHRLYREPTLLRAAQQRSTQHAQKFSARRMANQYLRHFQHVLRRREKTVYA